MSGQGALRIGPLSGRSGAMKTLLVPNVSNSARILVFSPVSAAMTAVTDATPMTMPTVVNMARVLLAQICAIARNRLW